MKLDWKTRSLQSQFQSCDQNFGHDQNYFGRDQNFGHDQNHSSRGTGIENSVPNSFEVNFNFSMKTSPLQGEHFTLLRWTSLLRSELHPFQVTLDSSHSLNTVGTLLSRHCVHRGYRYDTLVNDSGLFGKFTKYLVVHQIFGRSTKIGSSPNNPDLGLVCNSETENRPTIIGSAEPYSCPTAWRGTCRCARYYTVGFIHWPSPSKLAWSLLQSSTHSGPNEWT